MPAQKRLGILAKLSDLIPEETLISKYKEINDWVNDQAIVVEETSDPEQLKKIFEEISQKEIDFSARETTIVSAEHPVEDQYEVNFVSTKINSLKKNVLAKLAALSQKK